MKKASIGLGNQVFSLEVADTMADRAIGLSDRAELDTEGMLFVYKADHTAAYTMSNTNFDLDIAFFDKDQKFLASYTAMAQSAVAVKPGVPYRYVIELPPNAVQWNAVEEFTYEW
jgi:uncharacterized membrane protein (UPF0127 family)